jgi:DNA-binding NtrC family response regulator
MISPLPRVLFVDDEDSIRFALRDYFAAKGYDVDAACNVDEADALLAQQVFEVVIIDLRLGPDKQALGLELVSRVRERHPMTAVVLFTAHGTPEIARETRRLGATFLEKPLPLPTLQLLIEAVRPAIEASPGPRA